MDHKPEIFNPERDIIEVLRLGIIKLCDQYVESDEKHLKLKAVGLKQSRLLKHQLESLPGVKEVLTIKHDRHYHNDWVFIIDKQGYIDNFRPALLGNNINFADSHGTHEGKGFDAPRHWNRLKEISRTTRRAWGQLHSPTYATDVVQLAPVSPEPTTRDEQIDIMAELLLGNQKRGERQDWKAYLRERDNGAPEKERLALPETWVRPKNVVEMSNKVRFDPAARKRLLDAFDIKGRG